MNRDTLLALIAAALIHGGLATQGYLTGEPAPAPAAPPAVPTLALDLTPPPPPEEPELVEADTAAPAETLDLAPPALPDRPSAALDAPFVQPVQAPPPPQLHRGSALVIPAATRPTSGLAGLKTSFSLSELDQRPAPRLRLQPVIPAELKRTGLTRAEVLVGFIVTAQGDVRDAYIVRSNLPALEPAVLQAVSRWKFTPGRRGGAAVNTRVEQLLEFSLHDA